jgi:hypothetical protein
MPENFPAGQFLKKPTNALVSGCLDHNIKNFFTLNGEPKSKTDSYSCLHELIHFASVCTSLLHYFYPGPVW